VSLLLLAKMAYTSEPGIDDTIYLGDPRRAQPEKLQTILRQPVEKVAG